MGKQWQEMACYGTLFRQTVLSATLLFLLKVKLLITNIRDVDTLANYRCWNLNILVGYREPKLCTCILYHSVHKENGLWRTCWEELKIWVQKKGPMEVGSIQNEALRAMMINRLKSNFHDKLGPVGNEACLAGSEATAEAISESSPKEEPRWTLSITFSHEGNWIAQGWGHDDREDRVYWALHIMKRM